MHKTHAHLPVLSQSVKAYLFPPDGENVGGTRKSRIFLDATLGLGGHAELLLKEGATVIGLDADHRNLELARERLAPFGGRVTFLHENFRHLQKALQGIGVSKVDGILFDLGVSSLHFDQASRGFSFRSDGPLDMRYDDRLKRTAADMVAQLSEKSLADLFFQYGEEPRSRRIAKAIVSARRQKPITTTRQLVEIVDRAISGRGRIHPATLVFQALRIAVNDELSALAEALPQAISVLRPHGRLVVLSYHSLEDRIVKEIFRTFARQKPPILSLLTKKPLIPSSSEIRNNPRARSAKLRAAEKLSTYYGSSSAHKK